MRFRHFRSACKWGKCFNLLQQFYWFSQKLKIISIFTARKRSLGQGNIFSSVCQEFCSQGEGVPGQVPTPGRYTPPGAGTPPPGQVHPLLGRYTPWAGTPSPGRYTPLGRYTPGQVHPWAGTPYRQVHPPRSSACWDIRATSGRYASYWNALLLFQNLDW